ncbi:tRNA uridine-5-carboxymethylaminomethyl(34) synthesis GTPase MnmE [Peptococcaceae bacterium]|nr:tRNA uridine-5-carboxymethylaminomethyl(34) synthesis GTPase MnmE [Peptococcaceae bacterium]
MNETIAAIATPLGEGGIGIVRMSGPKSIDIAKKVFRPKYNHNWHDGPGFRIIYGHVVDPERDEVIDEVLLSLMRSPKSFTGEDVVEINCHGGILVTKKILQLVLNNGASLAEPGEFTRRAFLNGRIDLIQAESIIDIIRAKTETALKISTLQLKGELSKKINHIQRELLKLLAQIEASIDFPEDVEEVSCDDLKLSLESILKDLNKFIDNYKIGKTYTEGALVSIVGKPNVGKSSLMNLLLNKNRAIVTEIPGTTRDTIEEVINIEGIPVRIVDTAGLREAEDVVERIGVERSKEVIRRSNLVLFVLDVLYGFTDEDIEILDMIRDIKKIILINKIDISNERAKVQIEEIEKNFKGEDIVKISAVKGTGLEELKQKIASATLDKEVNISDLVIFSRERHRLALEKARKYIEESLRDADKNVPLDLLSINIRGAWEALGEITGSTVTENLVDTIFRDFCIGK